MMAILHGKKGGTSARGDRVPEHIASKYRTNNAPDNAPESKGKEHEGGKWGEDKKGEKKSDKKKKETKKSRLEYKSEKAKLRKAFENYLVSKGRRGAGCVVVDDDGGILLGKRTDNGMWTTPGGKVEDDESFEEGALRELREETGLVAKDSEKVFDGHYRGFDSQGFLVNSYKGKLKDNDELINLKFMAPHEIPWDQMTDYAHDTVAAAVQHKLKKSRSLKYMIAEEELQKNTIRSGPNTPSNTIYEVTHGDALRLIGNGTFRMLRDAVRDMGDEDFRQIQIDHYTLHLRKHVNDVYSGRITDGHKQVHQFTNKSLPAVTAELMSIFEWYLPEDEGELEVLNDEDLDDSAIEGGINELVENYRRHNISNMYEEMENIRQEVRNGVAVDLQQVEQRMMKLFDKLEDNLLDVVDKHNTLNEDAGEAIDMLENKLVQLQQQVDKMSKQPVTMEAYSSAPTSGDQVHSDYYPYLAKPQISIAPSGHITISFPSDWSPMEREGFLKDMKAKAVNKTKNK